MSRRDDDDTALIGLVIGLAIILFIVYVVVLVATVIVNVQLSYWHMAVFRHFSLD